MPYFSNDNIHVLYIHIPKTGGTTIEKYFVKKYHAHMTLREFDLSFSKVSLQHQTLATLCDATEKFGIDMEKSRIFASVRNPYTRLISHLYFKHRITNSMTPSQVEHVVRGVFTAYDIDNHIYDNHLLPQHLFVSNNTGLHVSIVKQENLAEDMKGLGFPDFDAQPRALVTMIHKKSLFHNRPLRKQKQTPAPNYFQQINMNTVNIINKYYKEDFSQFGYTMITSEAQLRQLQKT